MASLEDTGLGGHRLRPEGALKPGHCWVSDGEIMAKSLANAEAHASRGGAMRTRPKRAPESGCPSSFVHLLCAWTQRPRGWGGGGSWTVRCLHSCAGTVVARCWLCTLLFAVSDWSSDMAGVIVVAGVHSSLIYLTNIRASGPMRSLPQVFRGTLT